MTKSLIQRLAYWTCFPFFLFLSPLHACEKPLFEQQNSLINLTSDVLPITWIPVSGAESYELKYSLKIPEGRTLLQRERQTEQAEYRLSGKELPPVVRFQILVEVSARCGLHRSEPAFNQLSVISNEQACSFIAERPVLKQDRLYIPVIKGAQSFIVCTHFSEKSSTCEETRHVLSDMPAPSGELISITPMCNGLSGTPIHLTSAR